MLASNLIGEALERDGSAPFQVTSDAALLQTAFNPGIGDDPGIVRPFTTGTVQPAHQFLRQL